MTDQSTQHLDQPGSAPAHPAPSWTEPGQQPPWRRRFRPALVLMFYMQGTTYIIPAVVSSLFGSASDFGQRLLESIIAGLAVLAVLTSVAWSSRKRAGPQNLPKVFGQALLFGSGWGLLTGVSGFGLSRDVAVASLGRAHVVLGLAEGGFLAAAFVAVTLLESRLWPGGSHQGPQ